MPEFSRRTFLGSLAVTGTALAPALSKEDKNRLPVISKRVEKAFLAPGKMPNALQCATDGLWILDQEDPNKIFKVRYTDGSVIKQLQTEAMHASGITVGNGVLWIGSTGTLKTMKIDPETGKTLAQFDTPGVGKVRWGKPTQDTGAHGLEWVDGKYWIAVPPSETVYLIEPETGKVLRSFAAPGVRPHGLAWHEGHLWCVESIDRAIYKMDPKDGKLLAKIQLSKDDPEPHGLSVRNGVFWYCDAVSRWVCRVV